MTMTLISCSRVICFLLLGPRRELASFPTRRSSDLAPDAQSPPPSPVDPGRAVRFSAGRSSAAASRSAPLRRSARSEEHTSELQSRENLVCRLTLVIQTYGQKAACDDNLRCVMQS